MIYNICLISLAFLLMLGAEGLAMAAAWHNDLRISDIARAGIAVIVFMAVSYVSILG